MDVIYRDRQRGKTTALLRWLLGGHRVECWPGWSRVVVMTNHHRLAEMISRHADIQTELRALFEPGLGKLLLTLTEAPSALRRCPPGAVQVALDDAGELIDMHFGRPVDLIAITGRTAEGEPA